MSLEVYGFILLTMVSMLMLLASFYVMMLMSSGYVLVLLTGIFVCVLTLIYKVPVDNGFNNLMGCIHFNVCCL